jgi:hypothetical protein
MQDRPPPQRTPQGNHDGSPPCAQRNRSRYHQRDGRGKAPHPQSRDRRYAQRSAYRIPPGTAPSASEKDNSRTRTTFRPALTARRAVNERILETLIARDRRFRIAPRRSDPRRSGRGSSGPGFGPAAVRARVPILPGRHDHRTARSIQRPVACQAMRRSTGPLSTAVTRLNPRSPASRRRPHKLRHRWLSQSPC